MNMQLSNFRIKQGRRAYDLYNAINSFSFALITGNTITLYALALGASSTFVGLLTAVLYLSFFAIPLGKILTRRFTIIRTFAYTWLLRHASLLLLLIIPFGYFSGKTSESLFILLLAESLFNFFRGAGMISNNPVIMILAPGRDRSSYIVRVSLFTNGIPLLSFIFLTVLLWGGKKAGLHLVSVYNIAMIVGIVGGFISSFLLFRLPDLDFEQRKLLRDQAREAGAEKKELRRIMRGTKGEQTGSFFSHTRGVFKDKNFRKFLLAFSIIQFAASLGRPFIIVFGKSVYGFSDSIATILSICISIGAMFSGLVMRLVIDRMGSKPLFIIFTGLTAALFAVGALTPALGMYVPAMCFLIFFSVFISMGMIAQMDSAQAYFFSLVPEKALTDLSMLYFFVLGITGGVGSILGGAFLDLLTAYGLNAVLSYRLFFFSIAGILLIGMIFQVRLLNLGGRQVFETLAVLFSARDMRALNLLHKLDANENIAVEHKMLQELGQVASSVSSDELSKYLNSPRFLVRMSALDALSGIHKITGKNKDDLLHELAEGEFTTAATAARLLAKFKVNQALPLLRTALQSSDYVLSGESMLALAELNDVQSQLTIGTMLANAENPFILLRGLQAMERYGSITSVPLVLDVLRRKEIPLHIEDEAFLVLAELMYIPGNFYYLYDRYKNVAKSTQAVLTDSLDEAFARRKKRDDRLENLVRNFVQDYKYDTLFAQWIIDFAGADIGVQTALLVSVALDIDLIRNEPFRFFLCIWAIELFKNPALVKK